MSQGHEMQKHRADGLKGHLDTAIRRIETLESEFAEIEQLANSRLATACALQAEVEKLEHSLSDAMEQIEGTQGANAAHMARVAGLQATELADLGTLTHAARRLGVERSSHTLGSLIGLLEARVEELVLKFSKRTLAGIVFEDWHNSLSPEALSALSLRDFSRLVSMLVRDKPDQCGEGKS